MASDVSAIFGQPKRKTRGPKHRPVIDPDSNRSVDYTDWARSVKGWTASQSRRRKPHMPVIKVPGLPDQVIPAQAEAVLRGEQVSPPRRGRGRPRRTT